MLPDGTINPGQMTSFNHCLYHFPPFSDPRLSCSGTILTLDSSHVTNTYQTPSDPYATSYTRQSAA